MSTMNYTTSTPKKSAYLEFLPGELMTQPVDDEDAAGY
jgi:hypothetical protein